ncbi:MAG: peptide deformylase [Actinomycetota bacterium]
MSVRGIRLYPDPVLKQVASPVGTIDDDALSLATDLVDTMRSHERCVGVAANQIGVLRRCICVDVTGHAKARSSNGLIVLFDPEIVGSDGSEVAREGCLSLPDLTANVRRATDVKVRGLTPERQQRTIVTDAFEARALLHEIDHLDGILFLDRVDNIAKDVFARRR